MDQFNSHTRPTMNLNAERDPNGTDDVNGDWSPGSVWLNVVGNRVWTCIHNDPGAAIWALTGQVPFGWR